ncbi:methylated-DNA--[protein]-cysteine S-methyltransferase [Corynebacterium marquesiae]|uniref:methylated-DNA--[protein]-cysteine S-methyltransferase n=1 Tax=Corynebacterium marquesiae TaxID=2913503 RepID=UPI002549FA07|nr:methylated-DNA--[protein]-cysteine S-methyltransferase [Corynebacterium marquesiae]MDK8454688.1 methylated-DNA--[protein]-cysteine S-methyltransferase [Corynebacterium marquesiae]MDK8724807.1 methylated-DNA--[protein]-cysteine S-methyltransferase [Corynebacterium marquesiae]MDK8770128.1 methylated-DNA--[protein]-cysteine S-methyltransferase [Corynebacterium marquesiae]
MFRLIDSPLGPLRLQASPRGLSRVEFTAASILQKEMGGVEEGGIGKRSADVLDAAQAQLAEYFAGQRRAFELPLDPPATTDFRAAVHAQLAEIGYGETVTYRDVAKLLGRPGATRAVGSACGANPLLIVRPCHRVLRSDGGLGGYAGGLEAKRFLLTLEEN